ncbi:hypothetical protein ABT040_10975 [Streptomyces sp. NPDC002688]|uniref:hypothetical protein n=1 Tax=Streptomyces sp. NPDC002688 TaxID=3154423 RepID=UPI0033237EAC
MNSRTPAVSSAPGSAQPVDVRLMGDDRAVRALVAALSLPPVTHSTATADTQPIRRP